MKTRSSMAAGVAGLAALACSSVGFAQTDSHAVAAGVHLLEGRFEPGRQPDGNSVVFETSTGLVVVDSGRHREHTQRILDFAQAADKPIAAVINTHWHLDHIGGNPLLRATYPDLAVHASGAIEGAMAGFLAKYRRSLETQLAKPELAEEKRAALSTERALIDAGTALYPTNAVTADTKLAIGDRPLELKLEKDAVTGGDVWVYDPRTRVLVAGDLVTLPAPLFDTACPARWQASLRRLAAIDFKVLVPGHGPPLSRQQFDGWQRSYDTLLSCADSSAPSGDCIDGWLDGTAGMVAEADRGQARSLLQYYLDQRLRGDPEKVAAYCP